MKRRNKNNPATLPEWLEIATRGLAATGKERITREIEAHYDEAVQARVAQGEPVQAAEAGIIADLGEPDKAARKFRRSHLTEKEVTHLAKLRKETGKVSVLLFAYLSSAFLLLFARFENLQTPHVVFDAMLFVAFFFPTISFMNSRRPVIKARLRELLLLECFGGIAFIIAFVIAAFPKLDGSFVGATVPLGMWLFGRIIPGFLTWKKTWRMTDEFEESTGLPG
jgi:hypothetical protein